MKQFPHFLFFLALAVPGALFGETLAEAISLLNEEDGPARAKPILQKIAAAAPNSAEQEKAQFFLADCEYRLGNTKDSFWMLNRLSCSASSESLRASALFRLAMLQMEQGLDTEALASYEALARKFSGSKYAPMALMVQANYWLLIKAQKRFALPLYEEVAKKYPATEEGSLALAALPELRKMSNDIVREASEKYLKAMKSAKEKQKKKT